MYFVFISLHSYEVNEGEEEESILERVHSYRFSQTLLF